MTSTGRIRIGAAALVAVVALGTLGFVVLEHAGFLEALYMVVITISTVGFREVVPLSGTGRVLTIALIIVGVGTLFFTATAVLEMAVESISERRRAQMEQKTKRLTDHTIICGWGRVGKGVWEIHQERKIPCAVIERERSAADRAREAGALVVEGDATHDETLELGGIRKARALVAAVNSDSDNLVIVLSARALHSDLIVVARASDMEAEHKLLLAGADRAVSPQRVGARRLASLVIQPELADFIDLIASQGPVEYRVQRVPVHEGCGIAGRSLKDAAIRERSGAMVLAVEHAATGDLNFNPDPDLVLVPGDVLIGVGVPGQLERLVNACGG
ncbi:voltage-gated potassium channel Kch [bacterium BMS3Abin02]|nr:voltage-gated potassium channel Kch [bacterium BMS3Abin02]HDL49888.1 potassium channel protein [Actinomycetota bacterium]